MSTNNEWFHGTTAPRDGSIFLGRSSRNEGGVPVHWEPKFELDWVTDEGEQMYRGGFVDSHGVEFPLMTWKPARKAAPFVIGDEIDSYRRGPVVIGYDHGSGGLSAVGYLSQPGEPLQLLAPPIGPSFEDFSAQLLKSIAGQFGMTYAEMSASYDRMVHSRRNQPGAREAIDRAHRLLQSCDRRQWKRKAKRATRILREWLGPEFSRAEITLALSHSRSRYFREGIMKMWAGATRMSSSPISFRPASRPLREQTVERIANGIVLHINRRHEIPPSS